MNQVRARAITAAALVVAIAVLWLGLHNRTDVKNQAGSGAAETSGNASSSDLVRPPKVLTLSRTTSANKPDSPKANQHTEDLDGISVAGSSTSREIDPSDSVREPMPVESRSAGSITPQPYVLSESVKQECARIAQLAKANCNDHLNAIAQLANELRDPAWADVTEESMRSIVNSQPDFRVRSLECRSSVCALEVESPTSIFSQKHFQAISARVSDIDRVLAYEYPSSGVRIKVTSITFQRL